MSSLVNKFLSILTSIGRFSTEHRNVIAKLFRADKKEEDEQEEPQ